MDSKHWIPDCLRHTDNHSHTMSSSWIQSLRLASVVEDCSDQLDILRHAVTVQISRKHSGAAAQHEHSMDSKHWIPDCLRHTDNHSHTMSSSWIQSLRLASVVEDCSDQLDILRHAVTVQISRKHSGAAAQEEARLAKLKQDSQYISQQVSKLHLELKEKQSFSYLLQVVEEEEQKKMEMAENMKREAKRELERRKQTVERQEEELQQKTEILEDMQQLTEDLRVIELPSKIEKKHMEKNTELQLQRTQKEMDRAEKRLEDQLELLKKQLKEEERVHEESNKFLQNQHEELQQQLQQWQQRTKQMLQEKEQRLNNVRCKRTVNLDKLMEMRRKYREMEQVVVEDREEQEKLRQQQAEARAATKLQAWWRGCMVRRGLGSFKKAEEGKKGKKKKEGKKKKKK
ncbi:hypothetical protein PAMP_002177 [Pampus punctatissimus]